MVKHEPDLLLRLNRETDNLCTLGFERKMHNTSNRIRVNYTGRHGSKN
jgi:hypothetical protein